MSLLTPLPDKPLILFNKATTGTSIVFAFRTTSFFDQKIWIQFYGDIGSAKLELQTFTNIKGADITDNDNWYTDVVFKAKVGSYQIDLHPFRQRLFINGTAVSLTAVASTLNL